MRNSRPSPDCCRRNRGRLPVRRLLALNFFRKLLFFLSSIALLSGGATALAADAEIRFAEIKSAALGGRIMPVAVVVPAHAPVADARVLFFLHGRGRHHRSLLEAPAARAALLAAPFYVVLPQGEDGWYVDSPARPADRYGTYLEEVVAWAERQFPLSHSPARRGIGGWSMGGYGAVRFAETHADQFGLVSSVIGLLDFPRPETLPDGQNYHVPVPRFTGDPLVWERFNPLRDVASLRGTRVTLVLASRGFERTMNERFIAALEAQDVRPQIHRLEGGHEFSVVERGLPLVIADAAAFFRGEPSSHENRR